MIWSRYSTKFLPPVQKGHPISTNKEQIFLVKSLYEKWKTNKKNYYMCILQTLIIIIYYSKQYKFDWP